jgi:hypothetical protein
MNLRERIEKLEAAFGRCDDGEAVLLSPLDAALLSIERSRIADLDAPEATEYLRRIDALFESHARAIIRTRPRAMRPAKAAMALEAAEKRQRQDDEMGVGVEEQSRRRTIELAGMEAVA